MTWWSFIFTRATLVRVLAVDCRVSVRPSVTSRCSTETAKRRITQTTPHNSPVENPGIPTEAPNAGGVAANWRLSARSDVNLVRSQVYHTERAPCLLVRSP